jgi:uncharacterized protein
LGAAGDEVVVSDWIVAETGNGIARTNARSAFVGAARLFTASPRAQVITVGNALLLDALQLYENRSDKNWGLVDCASFVIMQNQKITDAFSNDRHFQQAGFNCLLPLP